MTSAAAAASDRTGHFLLASHLTIRRVHGLLHNSRLYRTARRVCRLVAQLDVAVERLSEPATSFDLHHAQDPNDTRQNS